MSERLTMRLLEPAQAHKALATAWLHCKAMLTAGHALEIAASAAEAEQDGARLQRSGSRVSMPVGRTKGAKVHGAPRLDGIVGRLVDTAVRNA